MYIFFERHKDVLMRIAIRARMQHKLGVLVIDLTNYHEIEGKDKMNCYYVPINSIPEEMRGVGDDIMKDEDREESLYFYIYNEISSFVYKENMRKT